MGAKMVEKATAAEVERDFEAYREKAETEPVTVTRRGKPNVVILSASEYDRLKQQDREALWVWELPQADIDAIEHARIPKRHRYHSSLLERKYRGEPGR